MKRIVVIIGTIIAGIITFLEISVRRKKEKSNIPYSRWGYEDVWWGN